jgi:hypothetical protein
MATHPTYTLDNADGATFRADLNNYIAALRTNASSSTAPAVPFPGMWWIDTGGSPVYLKLRDSTNSLWVNIYDLTNDRGILGGTADDSTSVNGDSASTAAVADTIARTGGTAGYTGNITGNITGYVDTVGGTNVDTDVLGLAGRDHKNLDMVDSLSTKYTVSGASLITQSATTGEDAVLRYKTPFSGDIDVVFWSSRDSGLSTHSVKITVNGSAQASPVYVANSSHVSPTRRWHSLTNLAVGDTIEMLTTWGAATSTNSRRAGMSLVVDNFGLWNNYDFAGQP